MKDSGVKSKLILQEDYSNRIADLKKFKPTIIARPYEEEYSLSLLDFAKGGKLEALEKIGSYKLNSSNGSKAKDKILCAGYDESKLKFLTLEGTAYFTTHSLVTMVEEEYLPVTLFTFYFYTKSEEIGKLSSFVKVTDDVAIESLRDYIIDRNEFLIQWTQPSTIMFIDGPLIGGNITGYSLKLIKKYHQKQIIPFFFVKNSDSNIIIDNAKELRKKYNSDIHWAYSILEPGYRSCIFKYTDEYNDENSKLFFYIKSLFHTSPQRIEFHPSTYLLIKDQLDDIIDFIYYLQLVHGDKTNLQLRPIAIAERFSREIIKLTNIYELFNNSIFTPTMNQVRFGD